MVDPAERVTRASESFLNCFLQWPVINAGQTKTWEDFEILTLGYKDFTFGLVNSKDNSIEDVKNYFDNSNNIGDSEANDKFYYLGNFYQEFFLRELHK